MATITSSVDTGAPAASRAARTGARLLDRLTVRGRLLALASTLGALGIVCLLVAVSGLTGQKNKVHAGNVVFTNFRTERDAYEGWLTADDQMNMYAALEVLQDSSQQHLASVTWGQVVTGHAQAISALRWLAAHAVDPRIRARARSTLADLGAYYGFTRRMHDAARAGRFSRAVALVTVDNAPASNRMQADFDGMTAILSRASARRQDPVGVGGDELAERRGDRRGGGRAARDRGHAARDPLDR